MGEIHLTDTLITADGARVEIWAEEFETHKPVHTADYAAFDIRINGVNRRRYTERDYGNRAAGFAIAYANGLVDGLNYDLGPKARGNTPADPTVVLVVRGVSTPQDNYYRALYAADSAAAGTEAEYIAITVRADDGDNTWRFRFETRPDGTRYAVNAR